MRSPLNPFAAPAARGSVHFPAHVLAPVRAEPVGDGHWWVPPALCTPLVMILAYVDFATSGIPAVWALGYLLPFAAVAATWLVPRTVQWRPQRMVLGVWACLFAFFYTNALMVFVWVVFIVMLLSGNVKS